MLSTPPQPPTRGFAPLLGDHPQVLILGSLPSVRSVREQQYYGHPQNRFWPVMGALFNAGPQLEYAQRADKLTSQGIAVWDVLASGVRPGSLDAAIQRASEQTNPLADLLHQHSGIQHICFNGRAAQHCFSRHIAQTIDLYVNLHSLPSTSPANAAWRLPQLIEAWSLVKQLLS